MMSQEPEDAAGAESKCSWSPRWSVESTSGAGASLASASGADGAVILPLPALFGGSGAITSLSCQLPPRALQWMWSLCERLAAQEDRDAPVCVWSAPPGVDAGVPASSESSGLSSTAVAAEQAGAGGEGRGACPGVASIAFVEASYRGQRLAFVAAYASRARTWGPHFPLLDFASHSIGAALHHALALAVAPPLAPAPAPVAPLQPTSSGAAAVAGPHPDPDSPASSLGDRRESASLASPAASPHAASPLALPLPPPKRRRVVPDRACEPGNGGDSEDAASAELEAASAALSALRCPPPNPSPEACRVPPPRPLLAALQAAADAVRGASGALDEQEESNPEACTGAASPEPALHAHQQAQGRRPRARELLLAMAPPPPAPAGSLRDCIEAALALAAAAASARRLEVDWVVPPSLRDDPPCPAPALRRLLFLLLTAAARCAPRGGALTLCLSEGPASPDAEAYTRRGSPFRHRPPPERELRIDALARPRWRRRGGGAGGGVGVGLRDSELPVAVLGPLAALRRLAAPLAATLRSLSSRPDRPARTASPSASPTPRPAPPRLAPAPPAPPSALVIVSPSPALRRAASEHGRAAGCSAVFAAASPRPPALPSPSTSPPLAPAPPSAAAAPALLLVDARALPPALSPRDSAPLAELCAAAPGAALLHLAHPLCPSPAPPAPPFLASLPRPLCPAALLAALLPPSSAPSPGSEVPPLPTASAARAQA
eukprot:tig00000655_g2870.t1